MAHTLRSVAVTALLGLVGLTFRCYAAPVEIPLRLLPDAIPISVKDINTYPAAVDAIIRAMVETFHLPVPRGKLLVYATREDFELGLIEHLKITPELAKLTARFAKSAVGGYIVLVNEQAVAGSPWPERIELLAHELAHSVQLTLANRPGIARPQWLIEGSAEWMAFNVTAALKLDDMNNVRPRLADKVRELRRKDQLPQLTKLNSFGQWVAARNNYSFDGTYSLAFLATDFLVAHHSFARVADFFRRFETSNDHLANFKDVFGESVEDFERRLKIHLDQLLK